MTIACPMRDEGLIESVRNKVIGARRLVVLTGAGVSSESGVPTFRGKDGLWRNFRAEELATPEAFARNPRIVWEWYAWRMSLIAPLKPNPVHQAIAELEEKIPDFLLVTQNIDGLHRMAGSRRLVELHGSIWGRRCIECGFRIETREVPVILPPRCESCRGIMRPDVVWFGEEIPMKTLSLALEAVNACDVMIVAGTSGVVQPAASFAIMAGNHGAFVLEVNLERTPLSDVANVVLLGRAGEIVPLIAHGKLRFVADRMLGRLAKWLRILGYDTIYKNTFTRDEVVRLAKEEGRILLTRDTHITSEGLPGLVFVVEDRFREQIAEVVRKLDLNPPEEQLFSLCAQCNVLLQDVSLENVGQEIPEFVRKTQTKFLRCPGCRRVYWGGTHRRNMLEEIKALLVRTPDIDQKKTIC